MVKRSLILILALTLAGCNSKEQEKRGRPAVPVLEVTPQVRDIPLYIESIGTLHPSAHVDIYSVIDGKIEGIYIAEGTEVSKGEKLIEIDPRAFDVKVKEAEAQLNIDIVHLQSAEKKRERYRHLAQKDLVAQVEWDEIESEVAKAMAVVELDRARLKAAELDLEQCTLTAPIAGKVGKFTQVKGDMIHASQSTPLMTIDQIDPLKVEFFLSGHEVCKLPNNSRQMEIYKIAVTGVDQERFDGEITFLDHHFDRKTGQCFARGGLDNTQHRLLPGQCVRIKIPIGFAHQSKTLPKKAIRYNEKGAYVYVIEGDSTVGFRQLVLGSEIDDQVVILEGIAPEDRVISDGHLRLSPGIEVEVKS